MVITMKTKIVLILVVVLTIFSACTPAQNTESEQSTSQSDTSSSSEESTSTASILKLEDFKENADNSEDIMVSKEYWVDPTIIDDFFIIRKSNNDAESNLMKTDGSLISEEFYFNVSPFSEGLAVVQRIEEDKARSYVIDKQGKVVIDNVNGEPIFSAIKFHNGMLAVMMSEDKNADNMICIDKQGKVVDNPPITHTYNNFYGDQMMVLYLKHPRYTFYENNTAKDEENPDFNPLHAIKFGIYDLETNKKVTEPIYHSIQYPAVVDDKTLIVKDNNLMILDITNNKVIKNLSESYTQPLIGQLNVTGTYLTKDGVVLNFADKPSIILDANGELLFKTNFEKLGNIVDGKIAFWKEGKVGVLDLTKKEVIVKPEYDDISNIYNGSVLLLKGEQWFIHKFK